MATQKIYIKEKKIWIAEVFFFLFVGFLLMNGSNFLFRATEKCEMMLRLSISLHFFKTG